MINTAMQTQFVAIDAAVPQPQAIAQAAAILRKGGLVAFPTETVYGLGANALDESAVAKIFEAKGRSTGNPLIVHVSNINAAKDIAAQWPDWAEQLAEHFWPGSLTLVVEKKPNLPDIVTAGGSTVALRVPAHPVALALIEAAGVPVAAPSANRSNQLSPTTAAHVLADLDGRIDLILDGGPAYGGLESTVLDVAVSPPRLLRPGLVSPAQIEAVIGTIQRSDSLTEFSSLQPARSPGMQHKHYAPRAELEVVDDGPRRVRELLQAGRRVGWLAFHANAELNDERLLLRIMPADVDSYSSQLYAVLHELDSENVDCIIVEMPPETDEWLAVRDRLLRAAVN